MGQYFPALTTAAAWRLNAAVSKACPKVVSESRVSVTWATSAPILIFLFSFFFFFSVLDLGPIYATDRRQTASSLKAPAY